MRRVRHALALALWVAGCTSSKPVSTEPSPSAQPAASGATTPAPASTAAPPATPAPAPVAAEPLGPGAVAPDFEAQAHDGSTVKLSALRGKPVVLYFYAKDDTPG